MCSSFAGKKIIDIGCGDGKYSAEFAKFGPAKVFGIDTAAAAIDAATKRNIGDRRFEFAVGSVYNLAVYHGQFDIALVRGVLHHLSDPPRAIAEILKTAHTMIIIEPNGFNPVLKVLEKVSRYHREHKERSFLPPMLRHWSVEAGGRITKSCYIGLVPMFAPDFLAKLCKTFEPFVERTPVVRQICCAQYVFCVEMKR